ncbi:hypothetical protein P154DRAFT_540819 [Amniculicola lignicola CBS 123094]|uniref:Uncharacterized protein n=1 Tax=Amniculicola lignicola CBS 123094 TaxID=1392246 RepID=A0A6A5W5N8_9PLEO|nr:hypothetical protein P154DRAFT_540819 [Amniculicola lignicola CBS 123094]
MERGEASDPPTLACVPPLPHSNLNAAALNTMSNSNIVNTFGVDIWREACVPAQARPIAQAVAQETQPSTELMSLFMGMIYSATTATAPMPAIGEMYVRLRQALSKDNKDNKTSVFKTISGASVANMCAAVNVLYDQFNESMFF